MIDVEINPHAYKATLQADIRSPDIPSSLAEQYAQCGEDVIVAGFAEAAVRTGVIPAWNRLVCVEVGANHAFGDSNSYLLEKRHAVRSILVEANPDLVPNLRTGRPKATVVNVAICADDGETITLYRSRHSELSSLSRQFVDGWHEGRVGVADAIEVPAMRIRELFEQCVAANERILLLSIDIEGADRPVILDTPFDTVRPVLVMLEPSERFHRGEGQRMVDLMAARGYVLFAQTRVNLMFVDTAVLVALADSTRRAVPGDTARRT